MRSAVVAALGAVPLLAGCTGSSDGTPDPSTSEVTPDASTSFDRDQLERQAREQAEQSQAAQDDLAERVDGAAEEQGTVVDITIKDGRVVPQGGRVEVEAGRTVRLRVTSDAAQEIHVHSDPERTYRVSAGGSIDEAFTVDTPGQVAIEAHELGVTIVQLVVR